MKFVNWWSAFVLVEDNNLVNLKGLKILGRARIVREEINCESDVQVLSDGRSKSSSCATACRNDAQEQTPPPSAAWKERPRQVGRDRLWVKPWHVCG